MISVALLSCILFSEIVHLNYPYFVLVLILISCKKKVALCVIDDFVTLHKK